MTARGLILAAPSSGSGKTVATALLLAALRARGIAVAAFKTGPDYIDPGFLAAAAGRDAPNLDPWGMRAETRAAILGELSAAASLIIGEGVMGLFDGARDGTGSTADLAAELRLPVILAVDGRGMAASAAALIAGFARHRADITVAGVLFTRIGHAGHYDMLADAARSVGVQPVGWIPRMDAADFPSRHLGLVQASEAPDLPAAMAAMARTLGQTVDLEAVMAMAQPVAVAPIDTSALLETSTPMDTAAPLPPLGQRIAVAADDAFRFAYPHVLAGWWRAGAEISFFSPISDEAPDASADAVYLPGGYPELFAGQLAAARRFKAGLADAAARGAVLYGECGGYMALGNGLTDADGVRHAMAGLLPIETSMERARAHIGYRRIWLGPASPLGTGAFLGHEHHHATETDRPTALASLASAVDATGKPLGAFGGVNGRVSGSFLHLIDRAGPTP